MQVEEDGLDARMWKEDERNFWEVVESPKRKAEESDCDKVIVTETGIDVDEERSCRARKKLRLEVSEVKITRYFKVENGSTSTTDVKEQDCQEAEGTPDKGREEADGSGAGPEAADTTVADGSSTSEAEGNKEVREERRKGDRTRYFVGVLDVQGDEDKG